MQIRQGAPSLSGRVSPPKQHIATLPGIPEATPGPNAFAQQAARMERHRLDGNAFYQQEMQKRRVTPPTAMHPALRARTNSDPPPPERLPVREDQLRESTVTTMSPFINAGRSSPPPANPDLQLVPEGLEVAEPTRRGVIEETREARLHEMSARDGEDRTPVYETYVPTPKPASGEFSKSVGSGTPRKPRVSLPSKKELMAAGVEQTAPKSPKKNFFEKLRLTKITGGGGAAAASPSMSTLASGNGSAEEEIPVKAQAVLGASPSKLPVRSPSKSKKIGLFSSKKDDANAAYARKAGAISTELKDAAKNVPSSARSRTSQATSETCEAAPRTGSSVAKTPQTGYSDPTHYSYHNGKRIPSQTFSDQGAYHCPEKHDFNKCAIARSQSLKYIDSAAPPTPPAKNTPPNERARKEAQSANAASSRVPFHEGSATPSKPPAGIVSTSDRISPTKFGSYAHKDMPTLVTQPSVYSLHASVVPELNEASTFEEMKARVDGLGLEGLSAPGENWYRKSRQAEMMYSPSVYNAEWTGAGAAAVKGRTPKLGQRKTMDDLPTLVEERPETASAEQGGSKPTQHTKQSQSTGSGCTIPFCYPELANDPSAQNTPEIEALDNGRPRSEILEIMHHHRNSDELPEHGLTHSRRQSTSPDSARQSLAADIIHDPETEGLLDADLFATPAPDNLNPGCFKYGMWQLSPASYSHPSAVPSPLHFLPATTYTPPPKKVKAKKQDDTLVPAVRGKGLGIDARQPSASGSPSPNRALLENMPMLSPGKYGGDSRPSTSGSGVDSAVDMDPRKPAHASAEPTVGGDKHDEIMSMLGRILERNSSVVAMRDEMRAANARLDERLAAVEHGQRDTPSPSAFGFDGAGAVKEEAEADNSRDRIVEDSQAAARASGQRVATNFAHEFYRHQPTPPRSASSEAGPARARAAMDSAGSNTRSQIETTSVAAADSSARSLSETTSVAAADAQAASLASSSHSASRPEQDTIAELREANRLLTETVKGFAARLEEMSRRMGQEG